jgi:hypothetical protein
MALSIMKLGIMTFSIVDLIVTLSMKDIQHNGLNCDTQHDDTQHEGLNCDTQHERHSA